MCNKFIIGYFQILVIFKVPKKSAHNHMGTHRSVKRTFSYFQLLLFVFNALMIFFKFLDF